MNGIRGETGNGIDSNTGNNNTMKSSNNFLNGQNNKFSTSSMSELGEGGREKDREKNNNNNNNNNGMLDLSLIDADGLLLKKSKRTYGDGEYLRFKFIDENPFFSLCPQFLLYFF